jgi:hypothetical protein
VPPGSSFIPPPPQVSFPQATQQYPPIAVIPPVVTHDYRTPTPSESPVVPSPPSRDGRVPFIAPDLGPARTSVAMPPGMYQPPIPGGEDEIFIPPELSYSTRTPSIESPRSQAPVVVPGPQIVPQQPAPPIFVHPPSQPPPSQLGRTPSPRFRSPTPSPIPGQPTIIVPPQPGGVPPGAPSSQRMWDEGRDQPVLVPPMGPQPPFLVASPRPDRSEPDGRREGPQQGGQPIIIHPPPQTHVTPSPYPTGPGMFIPPPSRPRSRSTTSTTTESPRPSFMAAPLPHTMVPGAPLPGVPLPGAPFPGPLGVGVPPGVPPIGVVAPSGRSPEPEYRSPSYSVSPRPYPESRAPSRYEGPGFQPIPPPMPGPAAIHIEPEPYRYRRGAQYPESRTPSSRALSPEEREPPRDDRPYRSPSPTYPFPAGVGPVPVGVGPEFDRGVGPTVIQPPPVTHVHQYPSEYPSTYPPRSPTITSPPPTGREGEPLPHPFGAPTQYPPTEQAPMPIGAPIRPSRAPTIVEARGPEPIQVFPPPDQRRPPRTGAGKCCNLFTRHLTN